MCIDSELATPLNDMVHIACDDSINHNSFVEQRINEINKFFEDFAIEFNHKRKELESMTLSSADILKMRNVADECCLVTYESLISLLNSKLKN